jgi:glutamine amidotransferase
MGLLTIYLKGEILSNLDNLICVVDYHKGNLQSVVRGLEAAGAQVRVSDAPADVLASDAVVLPGVGAFTDAMQSLTDLGLDVAILKKINEGAPFLGICLGMQLLFAAGTEHASQDTPTPGLGVFEGVVDAIPREDAAGNKYKVPHVGWNSLEFVGAGAMPAEGVQAGATLPSACKLFDGVSQGEFFYFTHSFMAPASKATVAQTMHSVPIVAAVARENVFGVQFHPEKSSTAGAALLKNFVKIVEGEF